MNRYRPTSLIAAAVIAAGLFACFPASAGDRAAEEAAIRRLDAQWSADLEAKRLDAVIDNYDENASFLAPNQPIIEGKAGIRAWFAAVMAMPGYRATFKPTRIVVSTSLDMAYETGAYEAEHAGPDGRPISSVGKHLVTWEKRDGAWRVTAESISSDAPAR